MPGDADGVTHVQKFEELEAAFADCVQPNIYLYARAVALNVGESGFAVHAEGENSPSHADVYALGLGLSGVMARSLVCILGDDLGGSQGPVKFVRIGRKA